MRSRADVQRQLSSTAVSSAAQPGELMEKLSAVHVRTDRPGSLWLQLYRALVANRHDELSAAARSTHVVSQFAA